MIKNFIFSALILLIFGLQAEAQISCTNAAERTLTNYTLSNNNDSLFIICAGQTATLVATPPSGTPGWNFTWQQFNVTGNMWSLMTTVNGVPVSTQANLQPGGYRVVITDGTNTEVGAYVAWVSRMNTNPSVSVNPIPAGCGNVQLTGQVNNGTSTPYYNPPTTATDPAAMLTVSANTEITVCYTGNHTWVSDLGFFLRGPAECGYPIITLSPNPGANGQGSVCNSNDNFNGLCFSTTSTANFNPCVPYDDLDGLFPMTSNYTGTYGSYGPDNNQTPIDWSPLYGCVASTAGWAVQIYDCINLDFGALTGATLSFSGTSQGGNLVTYTYQTPSGFSSAINDNSCTPETASIFEVPAPPPSPIYFTYGYEWTANPPFTIPNSTSSLNITLSPGPQIDTEFTLSITGNNPGAVCGGTASASQSYDFQTGLQSVINPINTNYCLTSASVNLTANITEGTWSGNGITNASLGTFNPATAGIGVHTITFTPTNSCSLSATITITVSENIPIVVTPVAPLCIGSSPIQLTADATGGTWSGTGVTNTTTGIFDPAVAGEGNHLVQYHVPGVCEAVGMTTITVGTSANVTVNGPFVICLGDTVQLNASGLNNYTWNNSNSLSGNSISNPLASPASSIVYTVSGTDSNGCQGEADVTVEVIQVGFSMNPSEGISPLDVVFTNLSDGSLFYWNFGNGEQDTTYSAQQTTSTTYYENGTHTVTLTAVDGTTSCSTEHQVYVYSGSNIILIPNVVTPDGNNENDVFRIEQSNLKTLQITILNRYGKEVGKIDTPNGSWNPSDFSDGTYYYVLKAEGIDGVQYEHAGYFNVVR